MTREEFTARQSAIVESLTGEAAHRAFDNLCAETLRHHGYDPAAFDAAAEQWHGYPYQARGERNGLAKLNPDKVREIRLSAERHCDLGRRLGVTSETVRLVRQGKTWRHVA